MPRNFMFTKEQVINAAIELTRERGFAAVTARALGEKLGSSSKPVFSLFENMEELQDEVVRSAFELHRKYLEEYMAGSEYPPYKASGMAYIRFAKEERELFMLLFMHERSGAENEKRDIESTPLIEMLKEKLHLSDDGAHLFHLEMWVFVHGIASMLATSYLDFDEEQISRMLTDVYRGLCLRFGSAQQ